MTSTEYPAMETNIVNTQSPSKQNSDFKQNGGKLYERCAFWNHYGLALTHAVRLSTSEYLQVRMLKAKCWPMLDEKFDPTRYNIA